MTSSPSKADSTAPSRALRWTAAGWFRETCSSPCRACAPTARHTSTRPSTGGPWRWSARSRWSCRSARSPSSRSPDARATLARVAQRYYRFPDRDLEVVGVTGTNGKTTVTHLIKHFLNDQQRVGLIGTVSYDLGAAHRALLQDHAGVARHLRDAGADARRRLPPGGHGGEFARHRPEAGPRDAFRRRRVHESHARPPRLPQDAGRLFRGEDRACLPAARGRSPRWRSSTSTTPTAANSRPGSRPGQGWSPTASIRPPRSAPRRSTSNSGAPPSVSSGRAAPPSSKARSSAATT